MGNIGRPDEYLPNPRIKCTLSWTGTEAARFFKLQLDKYENGSWDETRNMVAGGESVVLNLFANTRYRFRVKETGPFSDGDWSDYLEFTPSDEVATSSLETDDLNMGLVAGAGYIDLTWDDHPDLGGVAIYASTQGTPSWEDFREFVARGAFRFRFPTQSKAWFLVVVWDWAGRRVGEVSLVGSPVDIGDIGAGEVKTQSYGDQVLLLEADMTPGATGDMTQLESSFVMERAEVFLKEATAAAQKITLQFGAETQDLSLGTASDLYSFRDGILFGAVFLGGTVVKLKTPSTNTETVKVKVRLWGRASVMLKE